MAESQGRARVCRHNGTLTFQIEGRATAEIAPAVRRAAEICLAAGPASVRVDLQQCAYMDSTFIGTLLFLCRRANDRGPGCFSLVSPSAECLRLIRQIGCEPLFPVAAADELPTEGWTELPPDPDHLATLAFKRNVVEAHQELAQVEGPARERYRNLADLVADELAAQERRSDSGR
jgi:anti-sigma B factor antagonist